MKRFKAALALFSIWALLLWPVSRDLRAQETFNNQLMAPNGISTEISGNVHIHSKGLSNTWLSTLEPDGDEIRQVPVGSGTLDVLNFEESYLASDPDPQADRLYLLSPIGDFLVFEASTLQEIGRFNIAEDLTIDTSNVYDVATSSSMNTFVFGNITTYGDIAAFRPIDNISPAWFVTGLSDDLAFVMRIPMRDFPDEVTEAEVILMSSVVSPFTLNRARGIAIYTQPDANGDYIGQTTLPITAASPTCPDAVIRFNLSISDVQIVPNTAGVPSWGMDVDDNGFYLVTGGVGNGDCSPGGGTGHLGFICHNWAMNNLRSFPFPSFPASRPGDVAISSSPANLIYITLPNVNTVVRFPEETIVQQPCQ